VSLGFDESNDAIDDKQLEIHVRYYNESKREVVIDFLECKYTATKILGKLQITQ